MHQLDRFELGKLEVINTQIMQRCMYAQLALTKAIVGRTGTLQGREPTSFEVYMGISGMQWREMSEEEIRQNDLDNALHHIELLSEYAESKRSIILKSKGN